MTVPSFVIYARRVSVTAMTWSHTGRVMSRSNRRLEALGKEKAEGEDGEDLADVAVAAVQW